MNLKASSTLFEPDLSDKSKFIKLLQPCQLSDNLSEQEISRESGACQRNGYNY
jgi:hypothetical protein